MKFEKYHGTGNDFIIFNNLDNKVAKADMGALAEKLCHRNFGIGADGLIGVTKVDNTYFMDYWNSDGSFAEMCGNGTRCTAHYIIKNIEKKNVEELVIKTGDGDKFISISYTNGEIECVRVNMGEPRFISDINVDLEERKVSGSNVSMGNPHYIMFTDNISDKEVFNLGPKLESNTDVFENKTNVEFAQIVDEKNINLRVWERGCGETLACGTGASATVVAGILKGILATRVNVSLPGGLLTIEWDTANSKDLFLTGPSKFVFSGEITVD